MRKETSPSNPQTEAREAGLTEVVAAKQRPGGDGATTRAGGPAGSGEELERMEPQRQVSSLTKSQEICFRT